MSIFVEPTDGDMTEALQCLIDANIGHPGGREIVLLPGIYSISRALRIAPGRDFDAKIHLRGSGRRGVRIRQTNDNENIFEFVNSTQNLRGIVLENLELNRGATAILMERATYNLFRNISFFQTGRGRTASVRISAGSHANTFDGCWWVHTTGDSLHLTNGSSTLIGCTIGEDAGAIRTSGRLLIQGCAFASGPRDKIDVDGVAGMGPAAITVNGFGILTVTGCHGTASQIENWNFLNLDNFRRVNLAGNTIQGGKGSILNVRRCDRGHPLIATGNAFFLPHEGSQIYRSVISRRPQNWVIAHNAFEAAHEGSDLSLDTLTLDPKANVLGPNTARVGTL